MFKQLPAILAVLACCAYGQTAEPGAEAASMGGSYTMMSGTFSAWHNPGAFSSRTDPGWGIGGRNFYAANDIYQLYATANVTKNLWCLSTDFQSYGFPGMLNSEIGLRYAHRIAENWKGGLRLHYGLMTIPDEGIVRHKIGGDAGVQGQVKNWLFGVAITNILRTNWTNTREYDLQTFRMGAGYSFDRHSAVTCEIYKREKDPPDLRLGLCYAVQEQLTIRCGFSTLRPAASFGFSLAYKDLQATFSAAWHQQLGLSPLFDVSGR